MTLSAQVQKALEDMTTITRRGESEQVVLQADRKVIGMLATLVVTVAGGAFWCGVQLTHMQNDISKATDTVMRTATRQTEILEVLTEVHETLDKLDDNDHQQDVRVTKLEQWREMQHEWANMMKQANPNINVPPAPPMP